MNDQRVRTYVVVCVGLILLFLAGSIAFFRLMPPFENPDELGHVGYVIYLARHWELPEVQWPPRDVFDQEGVQVPLYYASAALFLKDAPTPVRPARDPAFQWAPVTAGTGPHRMYVSISDASTPLLRDMAAACSRVRIASIFWGLLAAIAGSALLWLLAKGNAAHAALALAIFLLNPRWMESSASASNDVAATATATATLLFMVYLLRKTEIIFRDAALLGFCVAIAVLTKLNNLGLILMGILVLSLKTNPRVRPIALFLVAAVLPLIPWMIRNHLLYGSFLATAPDIHRHYVAIRETPLGLIPFFIEEFQGFRWSYYAVFGQFAVLADPPVYRFVDWFLLIAGIAGIAGLVRDVLSSHGKLEKVILLFPLLWIAVVFAEFVFHNRTFLASQGRLIFPASACIAHILARGCMFLTPGKGRVAVALIVSALAALLAFYVVFSVLPRAYPVNLTSL